MEMQMNWFTMMVPLATRSLRIASSVGDQTRQEDDKLAESMDIAIGADVAAPSSAVLSISDQHSQPAEEESENETDIGVMAWAA
jgi:hypothetical protein